MGLELEADIHLGVALGEKLDAIHSVLNKDNPKPSYLKKVDSGLIGDSATGLLILDFGKPPSNKIWNVLGFAVYGLDDHTVVATTTAALYIGVNDGIAPLGLMNLITPGAAVPSSQFFSKDVVWCYAGENLLMQVTGPAAGQQVSANVFVNEWNLKDKW